MTRKALQQKQEMGDTEIMISRESLERMPEEVKDYKDLEEFENDINECTKCPLHKGRTKFVFGAGNPHADIIFVGEGPGREEDLRGEPFVGRAGKLLDKILAAIDFERSEVYIANIVKCRPPNNRDPESSEMETCMPYLLKQIEMINPHFICCLGRIAAQALLDTRLPLGKLRGGFHDWNDRKVMVTYHPAALLRFPQYKPHTWEDVQMLRKAYDEFKGSS
ncbi:MAG TPA: uracil-DNA glycosylase [candidate division Zixibacteria bacterium]|nr:uracil-DNA glycosylase [candidate division Zixibacteria bacterium]